MIKYILMSALSAIFFIWLYLSKFFSKIIFSFSQLSISELFFFFIGLFLSYLLRSLRIYFEFNNHTKGKFFTCLHITLIHNALVNILPMRGGEIAFPVMLKKRFTISMEQSISSLLWLRFQDSVILFIFSILIWPNIDAFKKVVIVTFIIVFIFLFQKNISKLNIKNKKIKKILSFSNKKAKDGWIWTFSNWTLKLSIFSWFLSSIIGITQINGLLGVIGGEIASILPIQGLAGFGSYEVGVATALNLSNFSFKEAINGALILHVCSLTFAISCSIITLIIHNIIIKNDYVKKND